MGAICWRFRPDHRDEDFRSVGAAQGTPEEIRFRARSRGGSRERAIGKGVAAKMAALIRRVARCGQSSPLGATVLADGVNFSVYSRNASGVELLFFDRGRRRTARPHDHDRSRDQPHLSLLARLRAGREAGAALRLSRPRAVRSRRAECDSIPPRFCSTRMAAAWLFPKNYSREAARLEGDNAATAMKSVVVDPRAYDWEGDTPLRRPASPDHHLRDARARLHAPSQFRRFGKQRAAPMPA